MMLDVRGHALAAALVERDAVARATAADPGDLDRQQAAVASWLAGRLDCISNENDSH